MLSVRNEIEQDIWWQVKAGNSKQVLKDVPTIIMWELWKRRNAIRHGKGYTFNRMSYQCHLIIFQLIKVKFPWIKAVPHQWRDMVEKLQIYKPTLYFHIVSWKLPEEGWVKCNTDGASRGNPGLSTYGFCIRNSDEDLIYAESQNIGVATNMEA
ncbi:hypothetical protein R3W88_011993 [Solanum pinnatisectum]|uniref:RNase H type-1 domain-containing protein n=1 Tax=Solanum pinnatisectum TaxID=50273 RepID=A0AAV9LBD2_9SOLN|nr:hypothetical protein R3W88_011993 [Solanum pinnatisectum]